MAEINPGKTYDYTSPECTRRKAQNRKGDEGVSYGQYKYPVVGGTWKEDFRKTDRRVNNG